MIPLMDVGSQDAGRYYGGGLVFYNGEPVIFNERDGARAIITMASGSTKGVPYRDLLVTVIEPFYDNQGTFVGHVAARRTNRAIPYSPHTYPDILSLLTAGDVPACQLRDGMRINKSFLTRVIRGVEYVMYRDAFVGFKVNDDYFVVDSFIQERLEKAYGTVTISVIPSDK